MIKGWREMERPVKKGIIHTFRSILRDTCPSHRNGQKGKIRQFQLVVVAMRIVEAPREKKDLKFSIPTIKGFKLT
jgi:hypothetical protein